MDKTEMYVRMADCEEVQGQWEPKAGDYLSHITTNLLTREVINEIVQTCMCHEWGKEVEKYEWGEKVIWIEYEGQDYIARYKNPIWLPTQDQIQGMMGIEGLDANWVFFLRFYVSKDWVLSERGLKHKTQEQLWLAFYMHKKHSKIWDGEKWIKSK